MKICRNNIIVIKNNLILGRCNPLYIHYSTEVISLGKTHVTGRYCGPFEEFKATDSIKKFALDQPDLAKQILMWLGSDVLLVPLFLILV